MSIPNQQTIEESRIFNEVESRLGSCDKEPVSYYPWARTFRLHHESGAYYLKITSPQNGENFSRTALISKHFSHISPEITWIDTAKGVLLLKDHGGIALGDNPTEYQLRQLLKTYAAVQAKAAAITELQEKLPTSSLTDIMHDFMAFLNPESDFTQNNPNCVNASFFLIDEEARGYHLALQRRLPLLEKLLSQAETLPVTLNHCDLHTQNAAEKQDGSMVLFDWDDAVMAPAGLSLHILFNKCSNVFRLLDSENPLPEALMAYQRPLAAYMDTLAAQGYTDHQTLAEALPATATAGVMYSLRCYAHYPMDDWQYKNDIGELFRERLEDLVALCDLLALQSRDSVIFFANDFSQSGAPWRSAYLLNEYLLHHPNDMEIQQFAAEVNMHLGNWPDAINNYQQILAALPEQASSYSNLGNALLKNQQPELAIRELENALLLDPDCQFARAALQKCVYVLQCRERARIPHLAPTIRQFPHEMENAVVDIENLDLATSLFRENGVIVIEDLFPVDLMKEVSRLVMEKYDSYFEDREYEDNLVLGDKRRMVTLEIEDALNTPQLYGNRLIDGLMQRLLSDDYVMGGLNAVVSLPHSKNQGLHKDYSPLFRSEPIEHHVTPPFAVAILTPLIDMTREHGVTSFRKGTHLVPEQMPYNFPTQEPLLRMGDGVVFDYRTAHEGLANQTDEVRPLLCMIFHRIWFRDALNYNQQTDVAIRKSELEKVPDDLRHLFKWTREDQGIPGITRR